MKNRKISTAIAEKVMTGVLTILMAISVTACGSTKKQANPAAIEVTEAVVTTETESETATEAKAENEDVTETEAMTETETEEPVLFRVKVTSENGAYISENLQILRMVKLCYMIMEQNLMFTKFMKIRKKIPFIIELRMNLVKINIYGMEMLQLLTSILIHHDFQ